MLAIVDSVPGSQPSLLLLETGKCLLSSHCFLRDLCISIPPKPRFAVVCHCNEVYILIFLALLPVFKILQILLLWTEKFLFRIGIRDVFFVKVLPHLRVVFSEPKLMVVIFILVLLFGLDILMRAQQ